MPPCDTDRPSDRAPSRSPTPSSRESCLGVVIPCYNEVSTIDEILRRVLRQPVVSEVVVVDDGSVDGTWEKLQLWPALDLRVKLLRRPENRGKGAAVRDGLAHLHAPVIAVQDADLEYDPADLPRMLAPILQDRADVVYGSRFGPHAAGNGAHWHRRSNRIFSRFCGLITGLPLSDEATGYKMFRRSLLQTMTLQEDGFGFCPEFTAKVARLGVRVIEVPVTYDRRSRAQGKKLRRRHAFEAVACILRYGLFRRRIAGS